MSRPNTVSIDGHSSHGSFIIRAGPAGTDSPLRMTATYAVRGLPLQCQEKIYAIQS